ncbi:MAG: hypothetical protein ACK4KV_03455 [Rhodocyclaceae bacterium]
MSDLADLPLALKRALRDARPLPPPAYALSPEEGYRIQGRAREASTSMLSGWKVALSAAAAQARLGLSEPVYGWLGADMARAPDSVLPLERLIAPKLEVEVAFRLGRELAPGSHDDAALLAAIADMAPALEVADSRWQGWRFDAGAFLADDAAAALYCIGAWQAFDADVCRQMQCCLLRGEVACARAETGDMPQRNLLWLLRRLLADGQPLRTGQIILSGALLAPVDVEAGSYRLEMGGEALAIRFENPKKHV